MAREMKDSGIECIGLIPQTWAVQRVKNLADVYTGNSIKDDQKEFYEDPTEAIPYIATKDIDVTLQTIDFENGMYVKINDDSFKRAPSQSTLLCIEGGSAGKKIAFIEQDVCFVNKLCCLHSNTEFNKFLYYYFMSPAFTQLFNSYISGLIGGVSVKELCNFVITLPPFEEQEQIAMFLDLKCKHIDSAIEKTYVAIEKFIKLKQAIIIQAVTKGIRPNREMKGSEIEWIDSIPRDWQECRIKNAIFPQQKPIKETDEIITCFRDGVVTLRKKRREDGFTVSFTEHGYQGVDIGDLVIHGMDAFAGSIGCSDSRGKTTPVVHVCSTIGNNRYFMYYLRSMAYGNILMDLSNGVRIRSSDYRNFAKLGVFGAIVPPLEEQSEIVAYLDEKTAAIDSLIQKKEQLISELEAYKKSLIYEYVTGKKEVLV